MRKLQICCTWKIVCSLKSQTRVDIIWSWKSNMTNWTCTRTLLMFYLPFISITSRLINSLKTWLTHENTTEQTIHSWSFKDVDTRMSKTKTSICADKQTSTSTIGSRWNIISWIIEKLFSLLALLQFNNRAKRLLNLVYFILWECYARFYDYCCLFFSHLHIRHSSSTLLTRLWKTNLKLFFNALFPFSNVRNDKKCVYARSR